MAVTKQGVLTTIIWCSIAVTVAVFWLGVEVIIFWEDCSWGYRLGEPLPECETDLATWLSTAKSIYIDGDGSAWVYTLMFLVPAIVAAYFKRVLRKKAEPADATE